jgi:hypothetical protein
MSGRRLSCSVLTSSKLQVGHGYSVVTLMVCSYLTTPCLLCDFVVFEVPGLVHHELEVVVTVNAHGDVVVVFKPLVERDFTVLNIFSFVSMVLLKGVQEFVQNLIFSLFACLNIGVHLSVVSLTDIVNVEDARLIGIHDLEGLLAETFSELVHLSTNSTEEFLVVD